MPTKISDVSVKVLERLEGNYKLIYSVLMSAPLVVALENFALSTDKSQGFKSLKYLSQFSWQSILLFIVFLGIHTRFYLGDLRYLDLKYLQLPGGKSFASRYSSLSRVIDFYSLIIHAIFFYFLAATLNNFLLFFKIYTLILILNSIWLSVIYIATDKPNRERTEVKNTARWIYNNIIFAASFVILYLISNGLKTDYSIAIFIVLALANTICDYALTWKMYFPKISETISSEQIV